MNNTVTAVNEIRAPRTASAFRRPENGGALDSCTLPDQFFSFPLSSTGSWTGARRLMLGVLEDAIANWFRYRRDSSTRGGRLFREAQEWLWSDDRSWLYSFASICEHLELDPDYVRACLAKPRSQHARQQKRVLRRPAVFSDAHRELAA